MAKKNTATAKPTNDDKRHAGRIVLLQETVDDLCDRITDNASRSFRVRASRAHSVSLAAKMAALDAVVEACNEARDAIKAADNGDDTPRAARVNLADL